MRWGSDADIIKRVSFAECIYFVVSGNSWGRNVIIPLISWSDPWLRELGRWTPRSVRNKILKLLLRSRETLLCCNHLYSSREKCMSEPYGTDQSASRTNEINWTYSVRISKASRRRQFSSLQWLVRLGASKGSSQLECWEYTTTQSFQHISHYPLVLRKFWANVREKKSEDDDIEKEKEELRRVKRARKATIAIVKATRMTSKPVLEARRANVSQPRVAYKKWQYTKLLTFRATTLWWSP